MRFIEAAAHLFVPRFSNNQKARVLHPQILILFVVKLMLLQLVLQFLPSSGLRVLGYAANISPEEVIALTNQKRIEAGLHPLQPSETLASAALAKGTDMINRDYWAHVAPDGTQPWNFFINAGYKYRFAGENLARDFSNAASAVDAWMASPSHRENMLSPKYKEIGIAVVEGDMNGVDTTIIVQFFGTKYQDTLPVVPVAEAKPSVTSTPTPTAGPQSQASQPSVETPVPVAVSTPISAGHKTLISPFTTTKTVSLIVVGFLLNVMVYDGLVATKKRITRIGGRTFAHLSFLGMVMAIVLILKAGQII
jgi:hypothetical protein